MGSAFYGIVLSIDGGKIWRFATQEMWLKQEQVVKEYDTCVALPSNKGRQFKIIEVGIDMTSIFGRAS